CIFTTSDKQSKEKVDILRAVGAEVIVCPTNVEPNDPRSYYSVAERLSKEIPNSCWLNQYDNPSNAMAHYESTGPEIWKQTDGKITHLVVGVGTGGTVSGTSKYLKEKNPNIKVWGIDTYGSVFKKYHETGVFDESEIYPYITEGIGEDILPKNVDFSVIDHFEKVSDKDGALAARRLAKEEGLLLGYSAGSALAGIIQLKDQLKEGDVVVVIFHDHGSRYVGKIFNDDWMRERGFLEEELSVKNIINRLKNQRFMTVNKDNSVKETLKIMQENDISQLPVVENGEYIGSIRDTKLLEYILKNPMEHLDSSIDKIMEAAFPVVDSSISIKELNKYISKDSPAVISKDINGQDYIITQYDIIQAM
ncbi:MAG TPA: pyridoxal-phosphate dependent enzyme, partial [Saprospiraceae bacterium]|nr:pyridoxal-phosphate dependent enzyme [Saprospiraceae bacterium]